MAAAARFRDPSRDSIVCRCWCAHERTRALVAFLRENGVLATGSTTRWFARRAADPLPGLADHNGSDIDQVNSVLSRFK